MKNNYSAVSVPIVALTGFMAAGKSTVGRVLASHLGWRFIDLDGEIESRTRLPIREIFAGQGEPRFRLIEAECLCSVLESASACTVIALGGGTFIQPHNADLLRAHGARVVFLELDIQELLRRCRQAEERSTHNPRPLAADANAFCALYAERLPSYRKADLTLDSAGKSADEVAQEIVTALHLTAAKAL
jgi:shikimate kinase